MIFLAALLGLSYSIAGRAGYAEQQKRPFTEGLEYQLINPPVPAHNDDGRIEIVELFLYACPHCNVFGA